MFFGNPCNESPVYRLLPRWFGATNAREMQSPSSVLSWCLDTRALEKGGIDSSVFLFPLSTTFCPASPESTQTPLLRERLFLSIMGQGKSDKARLKRTRMEQGKTSARQKSSRTLRFGKTLFMSMLAAFVDITKDSRELFEGLAVSRNTNLCKEWMNRYPVISLSLKAVGGLCFEDAFAKFRNQILKCVSGYYRFYEDPAVTPQDRLYLNAILQQKAGKSELAKALCTMSRALAGYYKRPVIVLIDEYDTPVVNAARGGYYDEMADFVRDFFGYTFAANAALKFGVLTGVMPITKKSLFGGLDSLRHYGVSDSDYADAIGFTQDEVDTLLAKAGLSSKREEVMDWYGGYRFGGTQAMYCPWNVQNYVVDHKRDPQLAPKAYWLGTGGNDLLQRLVAQAIADPRDIDALLDDGMLAAHTNLFPDCWDLTRDNACSILHFTGYLTMTHNARMERSFLPGSSREILTIPNREVEEIFREDLKEWFSHRLAGSQRTELYQAFWQADAEHFAGLLSDSLPAGIGLHVLSEPFCHCLLTAIFHATQIQAVSYPDTGEGSSHILVWHLDKAAVIAVKSTDSEEELSALLDKGMQQIVDNQYDARFRANPEIRTIHHWSVAFCRKSCLARAKLSLER